MHANHTEILQNVFQLQRVLGVTQSKTTPYRSTRISIMYKGDSITLGVTPSVHTESVQNNSENNNRNVKPGGKMLQDD